LKTFYREEDLHHEPKLHVIINIMLGAYGVMSVARKAQAISGIRKKNKREAAGGSRSGKETGEKQR
jgi:hypothetical protein